MMSRILVVEDQHKLLQALRQGLSEEGFEVLTEDAAESGIVLASTKSPDLMILDRMLPGRDGVEMLRELRGNGFKTPVLMLTARDQVRDRIEGLDAGADDYLVKPFDFGELLARVRACVAAPPVRGSQPDSSGGRSGSRSADAASHSRWFGDRP